MLAEIVPELFMKNLRAIPSKKQVNHLKRLKEISSGAAYLYKAVILPKMQGKEVNTGKVSVYSAAQFTFGLYLKGWFYV